LVLAGADLEPGVGLNGIKVDTMIRSNQILFVSKEYWNAMTNPIKSDGIILLFWGASSSGDNETLMH
jgi:hypothetical protein